MNINLRFDLNKFVDKYGPTITLLFLAALVLVLLFIYRIFQQLVPMGNNRDTSPQNQTQGIYIDKIPQASQKETCTQGTFPENSDLWTEQRYRQTGTHYCPHIWSSYPSPVIWYQSPVPSNFSSFTIKFKLPLTNIDQLPVYIMSVGDKPKLARFYIFENSPQIVGTEIIDLNNPEIALRRFKPSNQLEDPPLMGSEVDITIRTVVKEDNKMIYFLDIAYVSAINHKSLEDTFEYQITLPNPTPESTSSNIKIGFGTLKGNCIQPVSFEICTR